MNNKNKELLPLGSIVYLKERKRMIDDVGKGIKRYC